ncbi:YbfB/YjiJ family MFS transporter [Azospirillum sp. SYSU D00513]|uniref:YbfB/YjiJ family MFS transporter n=1 Tax=Azospirillum sp. SYSU D00513 TaxID=2812561 RepID=UPI001A963CF4|nr:YbfB/YjiJ family MFS transporter [Azospirillum sp. SYSU D00513]
MPTRGMRPPQATSTGAGQAVGGSWVAPALAGLAATLLGLGIARFAYTPMLPALVAQGWLDADGAAYLGAANLLGYLLGALAAAPLARRWPMGTVLRLAMLLTVLSLMACAWNGGLFWLTPWRVLAGATGAVVMVLAGPAVLAGLPPALKPRATGVVFSGIGIGVVLAGFGVPGLAPAGLEAVWLALAGLALGLTLFAWRRWPSAPVRTAGTGATGKSAAAPVVRSLPLLLFTVAYAGDGIGYVPHTLFLSDYVARGLGLGVETGGAVWAAFGVGAMAGALFGGWLAGRLGFGPAFALALGIKAMAVALPLVSAAVPALVLSAFLVGLLTPGSVALASGVAASLVGAAGHVTAWGRMTAAFAATQMAGGYALSALFAASGSHCLLFAIGAACLAAGTASALIANVIIRRNS